MKCLQMRQFCIAKVKHLVKGELLRVRNPLNMTKVGVAEEKVGVAQHKVDGAVAPPSV